jgi:hypothetical protein
MEKLEVLGRLEGEAKREMKRHLKEIQVKLEEQNRLMDSRAMVVGEIADDVRSIMTTL